MNKNEEQYREGKNAIGGAIMNALFTIIFQHGLCSSGCMNRDIQLLHACLETYIYASKDRETP